MQSVAMSYLRGGCGVDYSEAKVVTLLVSNINKFHFF